MQEERWLLPAGIEEILPPQARVMERLRRDLLDLYGSWGYELVIPPFVDYLESLLTGTGHDLDLQTFKLTDQLSGRMLGVRADMTPQVARIDAHHLRSEVPTRLCYLGTVLHTRSDGFAGTRSPMQIGAEIYGHSGCRERRGDPASGDVDPGGRGYRGRLSGPGPRRHLTAVLRARPGSMRDRRRPCSRPCSARPSRRSMR